MLNNNFGYNQNMNMPTGSSLIDTIHYYISKFENMWMTVTTARKMITGWQSMADTTTAKNAIGGVKSFLGINSKNEPSLQDQGIKIPISMRIAEIVKYVSIAAGIGYTAYSIRNQFVLPAGEKPQAKEVLTKVGIAVAAGIGSSIVHNSIKSKTLLNNGITSSDKDATQTIQGNNEAESLEDAMSSDGDGEGTVVDLSDFNKK